MNFQLNWASAGFTDKGCVRALNEDAFLDHPDMCLWVVADGMGGHEAGDVASQLVVSRLAKIAAYPEINAYVEAIQDELWDVNQELIQEAERRDSSATIGSTVVVMVAVGNQCAFLWAGDSRIYRMRDGVLEHMTTDHSQVQQMVDEGLISPEEAEGHPEANVITRAIGAVKHLVVDVRFAQLQEGDRYILFSDGLNKELSDAEIASIMQFASEPTSIAEQLIRSAIDRGSRDNVTVVAANTLSV